MENKDPDNQEEPPADSKKESLWYHLYHKPRVLEKETTFFIFVSAMDLFMTYILLREVEGRFVESNAVANYFLGGWGIRGMIYYKFGLVAFVSLIAQYIAQTHFRVAKYLLYFASLVVTGVVIYSMYLYFREYVAFTENFGIKFL